MRLPAPTARTRLLALVAVLLSQTAMFLAFCPRPPVVVSDNVRYELPAEALAHGGRLALPRASIDDAVVRGWVCSRHPEACNGDTTPTALYPPGYTLFIASIYVVTGRSITAIVVVQLLLLWLLFFLFEKVAFKYLGRAGWWFVMTVAFTYPFVARQATMVMSDFLHVVLLFAALAAFMLMRPGARRGVLVGGGLAAATLVRPYSLIPMIALFAWPAPWRALCATRRERFIAVAVAVLPFVLWTARNAYWFGRFLPLSTTGLGATLYTLMLECQHGSVYNPAGAAFVEQQLGRFGDPVAWGPNHELQAAAISWLREHPVRALAAVLLHVPKVWISMGIEGQRLSLASAAMAIYLGALWLLGLVGAWCVRRDRRWWALMVTVAAYWAFVLTAVEARRTLPLRLPMLLSAGAAVDWWVARRRGNPIANLAAAP